MHVCSFNFKYFFKKKSFSQYRSLQIIIVVIWKLKLRAHGKLLQPQAQTQTPFLNPKK